MRAFCIIIRNITAAMLAAAVLTGCAPAEPAPAPAPVMREVYADSAVIVDANVPERIGEKDGTPLYRMHLHIANRTDRAIILSTRLCFYVGYGEQHIECITPRASGVSGTDIYNDLDGIIAPDEYADGWLVFACGDIAGTSMNIAVDYLEGYWATFAVPAE